MVKNLCRCRQRFVQFLALLMLFTLAACTARPTTPLELPSQGPAATPLPATSYPQPATDNLQPATDNPQPATDTPPTATAVPEQPVYLPAYLPQGLRQAFHLPQGYYATSEAANAEIRLDLWTPGTGSTQSLTWWTYALVTPFPTIPGEVSAAELRGAWSGESSGSFAGLPLLMGEETWAVLSAWWGEPADGAVQTVPEGLVETAWAQRPSWAIIPFEALEPRWKVLAIDGISPLSRDFDPASYALSVPFALTTPPGLYDWSLPIGNRDPNRLTIVNMTGVTALVRGTALWMERYGIPYPARDVGSLLANADITHINNEVPFVADCPEPVLDWPWLVSCSPPDYIELLEIVGADVIELTGDHFGDWPPDSMDLTLSLYEEQGMATFGGGLNAELARLPALFEHNGNRLAFIGCHIGSEVKTEIPEDALASAELPGAAACDFDWLQGEIESLTSQGYLVIFTFQHQEIYTYTASERLVADFGLPAQMGATIVSGSQAHQPHGFAIDSGAFIHYGLGNLFFDQFHYCADYACDRAFIDRHVFYAGRHISTELIPIKFVDFARPRLMTPEEAARFLEIIFTASGW
jgi:predicted small lipoprotein YifL